MLYFSGERRTSLRLVARRAANATTPASVSSARVSDEAPASDSSLAPATANYVSRLYNDFEVALFAVFPPEELATVSWTAGSFQGKVRGARSIAKSAIVNSNQCAVEEQAKIGEAPD